jgi:uncharacterized FAD-dependent dehydrogenase
VFPPVKVSPKENSMLRLTEVQLPLNHAEDALRAAIVARLGIADDDLTRFEVFKRGYDARKKTSITLVYTVDVELRNEQQCNSG